MLLMHFLWLNFEQLYLKTVQYQLDMLLSGLAEVNAANSRHSAECLLLAGKQARQ
jgi:hypothetical protein